MCPFGSALVKCLLFDANSGMYITGDEPGMIDAIQIERWMVKMEERCTPLLTAQRMALALSTAANAVLGRKSSPRSLKEVADAAASTEELLQLQGTERHILQGVAPGEDTNTLVFRAAEVKRMAGLLQKFAVSHDETMARLMAESYFQFAQKECALRGHGLPGVVRAVGIVLGQISLEEVVFG